MPSHPPCQLNHNLLIINSSKALVVELITWMVFNHVEKTVTQREDTQPPTTRNEMS